MGWRSVYNFRMPTGPQKDQGMVRVLELPSLQPSGRGEKARGGVNIGSCLHDKASIKIPELWGSQSCWDGEYKHSRRVTQPNSSEREAPALWTLWILHYAPVKLLSHVRLFATPWTIAYQAPPSMGFSRQEYWSGLPFPSPGDLPNPGIEPRSSALQAVALSSPTIN